MSDERHLSDALEFERWWDRLIQGKAPVRTPNLDPDLEAFAWRVHALDDLPSPDPTFKRQLWEDLLRARATATALPAPPFSLDGRLRQISAPALPRPIDRRRVRPRLSTGLSWAATTALIAATVAMIFFTFHQEPRVAVPPLQETPTPVASPAADATAAAAATPSGAAAPTFAWATRGGDLEKLENPMAVAVNYDGTVWVADVPGRLLHFDADGNYLETWDSPGTGRGQFDFESPRQAGVFIALAPDGSLYVSDINNHRVQHFDKDFGYLGEWGLPSGTGDGQLIAPDGIWILPDGTLLVADEQRGDIQHFSSDGAFLDRFDAAGTTDGPLQSPAGIAVDGQGRLIVAEYAVGRVRVFDQAGQQVGTLDVSGQQPPFFKGAVSVQVDAAGDIYVCDFKNGLIRVFNPDLTFAYQWGNTGENDQRLNSPGWMAFGRGGAIYVTDHMNTTAGRLFRFNAPSKGSG